VACCTMHTAQSSSFAERPRASTQSLLPPVRESRNGASKTGLLRESADATFSSLGSSRYVCWRRSRHSSRLPSGNPRQRDPRRCGSESGSETRRERPRHALGRLRPFGPISRVFQDRPRVAESARSDLKSGVPHGGVRVRVPPPALVTGLEARRARPRMRRGVAGRLPPAQARARARTGRSACPARGGTSRPDVHLGSGRS
jgi:hypothetical protein